MTIIIERNDIVGIGMIFQNRPDFKKLKHLIKMTFDKTAACRTLLFIASV